MWKILNITSPSFKLFMPIQHKLLLHLASTLFSLKFFFCFSLHWLSLLFRFTIDSREKKCSAQENPIFFEITEIPLEQTCSRFQPYYLNLCLDNKWLSLVCFFFALLILETEIFLHTFNQISVESFFTLVLPFSMDCYSWW